MDDKNEVNNEEIRKIFLCKVKGCNLYIKDPVFLPCGFTICGNHYEKPFEKFKCELCDQMHETPSNGFLKDKNMAAVFNQNLHLFDREYHQFVKFCLDDKLNAIASKTGIKPSLYIKQYFARLIEQLDAHEKKLTKHVQTMAKSLRKEANRHQIKCLENAAKLSAELIVNEYEREMYKELTDLLYVPDLADGPLQSIYKLIQVDDIFKGARFDRAKFEDWLLMNERVEFVGSEFGQQPHFAYLKINGSLLIGADEDDFDDEDGDDEDEKQDYFPSIEKLLKKLDELNEKLAKRSKIKLEIKSAKPRLAEQKKQDKSGEQDDELRVSQEKFKQLFDKYPELSRKKVDQIVPSTSTTLCCQDDLKSLLGPFHDDTAVKANDFVTDDELMKFSLAQKPTDDQSQQVPGQKALTLIDESDKKAYYSSLNQCLEGLDFDSEELKFALPPQTPDPNDEIKFSMRSKELNSMSKMVDQNPSRSTLTQQIDDEICVHDSKRTKKGVRFDESVAKDFIIDNDYLSILPSSEPIKLSLKDDEQISFGDFREDLEKVLQNINDEKRQLETRQKLTTQIKLDEENLQTKTSELLKSGKVLDSNDRMFKYSLLQRAARADKVNKIEEEEVADSNRPSLLSNEFLDECLAKKDELLNLNDENYSLEMIGDEEEEYEMGHKDGYGQGYQDGSNRREKKFETGKEEAYGSGERAYKFGYEEGYHEGYIDGEARYGQKQIETSSKEKKCLPTRVKSKDKKKDLYETDYSDLEEEYGSLGPSILTHNLELDRPISILKVSTLVTLADEEDENKLSGLDSFFDQEEIMAKSVQCVNYIEEENMLVAGCFDAKIRLWELSVENSQLTPLVVLSGKHESEIVSIQYNHSIKTLISLSRDGWFCAFKLNFDRLEFDQLDSCMKLGRNANTSSKLLNKQNMQACALDNGLVQVIYALETFDRDIFQSQFSFTASAKSPVQSIKSLKSNNVKDDRLITGHQNGHIGVFEFNERKFSYFCKKKLNFHESPLTGFECLSDDELISYSSDGLILIWNVKSYTIAKSIHMKRPISQLKLLSNNRLAVASAQHIYLIDDVMRGELADKYVEAEPEVELKQINTSDVIKCMDYCPKREWLFYGTKNGLVKIVAVD